MSSPMASLPTAGTPTRVPVGGLLTPRAERLIRIGSVGSALIIAISAMVLSYAGLHDLALDAQVHPRLALLVPIMVDGLQFVGSLGVVYSTLSGLRSWYPWLLMLMGVSISAWGNWQAAPDDLTAKLLHAAAPIILALVLEELLRVMRHKVQLHAAAWEAEQDANTQPQVEGEAREAQGVPEREPVAPVVPQAETALPVEVTEFDVATHHPEAADQSVTSTTETAEEAAVAPASVQPSEQPAPVEVPVVATQPVTDATPVPTPVADLPQSETLFEQVTPAPAPAPAPVQAPVVEQPAAAVVYDDETLPPYPAEATFKEQVKAILSADPDIRPAKIARLMSKDPSYTRKTVREARSELDAEAATTPAAPAPTSTPAPAPDPVIEPDTEPAVEQVAAPVVESSPAQQPMPVTVQPLPVNDAREDDLDDADPFATAAPMYAAR